MKLGRFVVSRFKNYKLSFNTGDQIEVTHSKIHDMLGIPVGGHSLFNLVERETGDEFVKKWAAQFSPKELKQIRVNDIARILVGSKEIDFLFKVNFLTLFTNIMCKADGLVPSCFAIFTFEPLTLSLTSMPSCDLESLTNILILCLILKASDQSLRKSLSLNLELS
ncbi:hypothetical protein Tco_1433183 [Tanacetum coccineum]